MHHKYMSGGFCPTIYAYKNFTEGDLRYEATFMEDIYDQYYYCYTKSNPGHITYHYTKWYETDFDEAAWRAEVKPGFEAAMNVAASDIDIDFILDERGREMLGEYKRWEDLKRTGKLVERVVLHNIEQPATTAEAIGQKILRPIPLSAIELNKEEVQQNPGF